MIYKFKRGFSLIETLFAVLILSVSIAGPLSIVSRGVQSAVIAKDQIIGYYLAQDAIEYIRYVRDTNKLAGSSWLAGLDGTANSLGIARSDGAPPPGNCTSANGCSADSINNTITACLAGVCSQSNTRITYDTTTGNYRVGGTLSATLILPPQNYRRSIVITKIGNDEAEVKVTVTWSDTGATLTAAHTLIVRESIYNWQ